jgi:hypothetical protein
LDGNAARPGREQLTLIRVFEELRGRGYDGGYDALRRYARRWAKQHGQATAAAYVPLWGDCVSTASNVGGTSLQPAPEQAAVVRVAWRREDFEHRAPAG